MQKISNLVLTACISATLAAVPFGMDLNNPLKLTISTAVAGNGNGNGGNGNGNGGGGNGKSEGRASVGNEKSGSSARSKNSATKPDGPIATAFGKLFGTGKTAEKRTLSKNRLTETATVSPATEKSVIRAPKPPPKPEKPALVAGAAVPEADVPKLKESPTLAAKLGGLNSLNRNYHAYLNSSDPRMAAIREYVVAYAQFELDNGVDALPSDPALGDEALSAALVAAANKEIATASQPGDEVVADPEVIAWAKDVLGVGSAIGKIDEVRDAMANEQPVEEPTDEVTEVDPPVPVTTQVVVVD